MKAFADQWLGKFISRKLTVLVVACLFVYLGKIDGSEWIQVAMIYIGGQALADFGKSIKGNG